MALTFRKISRKNPLPNLMRNRGLQQRGWSHETQSPHRDTISKKIARPGDSFVWRDLDGVIADPSSFKPLWSNIGLELEISGKFEMSRRSGRVFAIKIDHGHDQVSFNRTFVGVLTKILDEDLGYTGHRGDASWESRSFFWDQKAARSDLIPVNVRLSKDKIFERAQKGIRLIELVDEGGSFYESLVYRSVVGMLETRVNQLRNEVRFSLANSVDMIKQAEREKDSRMAKIRMGGVARAANNYVEHIEGLLKAKLHLEEEMPEVDIWSALEV